MFGNLLKLAQGLAVVFETRIEFTDDSFQELNEAQYASYCDKVGKPKEAVYRIVLLEPTALPESEPGRTTLELSTVTESEKSELIRAVQVINSRAASENLGDKPFEEKLAFFAKDLPPDALKSLGWS